MDITAKANQVKQQVQDVLGYDETLVLSAFWDIAINGVPLTDEQRLCVRDIVCRERDDGSDTCSIVLSDPDFVYINDNIFIEEVPVTVTMGWQSDLYRYVFSGYISAIDISFPESGYPQLNIFCLDRTHLMNRKKKKRTWENTTSAVIVQQIAQEYGFTCKLQDNYTFRTLDSISQSNQTDMEFLEGLARREREPFICKLIDNEIQYVKKGVLTEAVTTLYYKSYPFDVVSFAPRINKETRREQVDEADINTEDKQIDSATANNENTNRDVTGTPVKTSSSPTAMQYNPESRNWNEVSENG